MTAYTRRTYYALCIYEKMFAMCSVVCYDVNTLKSFFVAKELFLFLWCPPGETPVSADRTSLLKRFVAE